MMPLFVSRDSGTYCAILFDVTTATGSTELSVTKDNTKSTGNTQNNIYRTAQHAPRMFCVVEHYLRYTVRKSKGPTCKQTSSRWCLLCIGFHPYTRDYILWGWVRWIVHICRTKEGGRPVLTFQLDTLLLWEFITTPLPLYCSLFYITILYIYTMFKKKKKKERTCT